jgi:hypothetical protein
MATSIAGTNVLVQDEQGGLAIDATFAGGTPPTTTGVFAPACRLVNINSGVVYRNVGTTASPSWDADTELQNRQETITVTGTISSFGHTIIDSTAGAIVGTLGAGTTPGQIKTITMQNATASSTVSITNHQTSDPEVATFDAVDETGVFMWTGTEWVTIFATCTFV